MNEYLPILKVLLGEDCIGSPDELLLFYLETASAIICDIRDSDKVESKYVSTMYKIAVELFSKRGAEGEVSHSENGISRTYASASISPSLLAEITPRAKTPFSQIKAVE